MIKSGSCEQRKIKANSVDYTTGRVENAKRHSRKRRGNPLRFAHARPVCTMHRAAILRMRMLAGKKDASRSEIDRHGGAHIGADQSDIGVRGGCRCRER